MGINGAEVRRLRTEKGWSQMRLEEESEVSQSNISRIERGLTIQGYTSTVQRLAKALGCAPSQIEDGAGEGPDIQSSPDPGLAPAVGTLTEFEELAAEILAGTPEAAVAATRTALDKLRDSSAMQRLDMPLTLDGLEAMVKVVSRHSRRRPR